MRHVGGYSIIVVSGHPIVIKAVRKLVLIASFGLPAMNKHWQSGYPHGAQHLLKISANAEFCQSVQDVRFKGNQVIVGQVGDISFWIIIT